MCFLSLCRVGTGEDRQDQDGTPGGYGPDLMGGVSLSIAEKTKKSALDGKVRRYAMPFIDDGGDVSYKHCDLPLTSKRKLAMI